MKQERSQQTSAVSLLFMNQLRSVHALPTQSAPTQETNMFQKRFFFFLITHESQILLSHVTADMSQLKFTLKVTHFPIFLNFTV